MRLSCQSQPAICSRLGFPGVSWVMAMAEVDARDWPGREEDFGERRASLGRPPRPFHRWTYACLQRTRYPPLQTTPPGP